LEVSLISSEVATSAEAFEAVFENKELFASFLSKTEPARVGDLLGHCSANTVGDPRKALGGPLTDICRTYFVVPWTCAHLSSSLVATLNDPTPENKEAFQRAAQTCIKARDGKWTYGW
jgi:hypothetical protein